MDNRAKTMDKIDDVLSETKVMSQIHSVDDEFMDISDIDL